jgi:hypothetical protein
MYYLEVINVYMYICFYKMVSHDGFWDGVLMYVCLGQSGCVILGRKP